MSFYDNMAALAIRMLDKFGGDAQLVRSAPASEAFNKRAGRPSGSPSSTAIPVKAVVGPQDVTTDDGRIVTRTVATLLVEAQRGDKLTMGGSSWLVGNVTRIAPIGQPIIYLAEVSDA